MIQRNNAQAETSSSANNKTLNILLVEDYEANVLVATTILEQMGHYCEVARDGKEAIDKHVKGTFDIILMDVQMHDMDGFEVTRIIRENEARMKRHPAPVIAMTAHTLIGDREKCIQAGMDDYISKPFRFDQLQEKLNHYAALISQ